MLSVHDSPIEFEVSIGMQDLTNYSSLYFFAKELLPLGLL